MDDLLQQGITAYKAGKRDEARKIFITVVKQSPDNEQAWQFMYNVCDTDKDRIYCLKQILRINPKNEKANQLLNQLLQPPPPSSTPPIPHPQSSTLNSPLRQVNSSIQYLVWGIVLFFFIVISGVIGFVIFSKEKPALNEPNNNSTLTSEPQEVKYSRKAAEVTTAYVQANEKISGLQGQLSSNGFLVVDATWQANYFSALDELESVCRQMGALPVPPPEKSESDYWLRLLASECNAYVSNERTGIKYGNTNALDMASINLDNMIEYFHNAATALPK